MKRKISIVSILVAVTLALVYFIFWNNNKKYDKSAEEIHENKKETVIPAEVVLDEETDKNLIIAEINNEKYGNIQLNVGNDKIGFRHILKRHSVDYYKENVKGSTFPKGTKAEQILKGIKDFYSDCKHGKSNNEFNKVFENEVEINGEIGKYRLVVNSRHGFIVTFYKVA